MVERALENLFTGMAGHPPPWGLEVSAQ
jgi:hypothetical protein